MTYWCVLYAAALGVLLMPESRVGELWFVFVFWLDCALTESVRPEFRRRKWVHHKEER